LLRQEELTFTKAITRLELYPAFLKEIRKALKTQRKKKPLVIAGGRRTTP